MKSLLEEVSGLDVNLKERGQLANAVETAEDWIGRVREAIVCGEGTTLSNLELLLMEADSIPVNMDEHQLLLCEIKARRWVTTVRETLERKSTRLEQLQKLLFDFDAIREAMPLDARAKKSYRLEEETKLRSIVSAVEAWRAKAKRATSLKRGTPLSKLQGLIEEAGKIPVDLKALVRPIETILQKAAEWCEANKDIISVCAAWARSRAAGSSGEGGGMESESEEVDGDSENNLAFAALEASIAAAEKVNAHLNELDLLTSALDEGRLWVEKAEMLCPKRQTKRSSSKTSEKPTEDDLNAHTAAAGALPFDFSSSIERLGDAVALARTWQQQATNLLGELEAEHDVDLSDTVSGVADFPHADEELLERLRQVLRDADMVAVRTDEEAILDRYLAVYAWCQDLRSVLDPKMSTRLSWSLNELQQIVSAGRALFPEASGVAGGSVVEGGDVTFPSMPLFLQPVLSFGDHHLGTLQSRLVEMTSWTKAARKALDEPEGVGHKALETLLKAVFPPSLHLPPSPPFQLPVLTFVLLFAASSAVGRLFIFR